MQNLEGPGKRPEVDDVRPPIDETGPDAETPEIDWKQRYVRLAADFDNFRKRVREEDHQMRRQEQAGVIATWLDPLDAMERALDTATDKTSARFEGLPSIHR